MKILILSKYFFEGPSSRYRFYNYIPYFNNRGHSVEIRPLLFDGYVKNLYENKRSSSLLIISCLISRILYIIRNKKKFDLIIIEKELVTYLPYFFEKFLLHNTKYFVDYDDDVEVLYTNKKYVGKIFSSKIFKIIKNSSYYTAGNNWYPIKYGAKNFFYLPTVVDIDKYMNLKNEKENIIPVVVWIGSPSTIKYLKNIENILNKVEKVIDYKLRIIGANVRMNLKQYECIEWSDEKEVELIKSSDIGIMPLENTQWENGKCGFKLIQYMASNLPTIASYAPANLEITDQGITGYIVYNELEWEKHLIKLLNDKGLRKEMGIKAFEKIKEKYTYQVWGEKFVDLVESINNSEK